MEVKTYHKKRKKRVINYSASLQLCEVIPLKLKHACEGASSPPQLQRPAHTRSEPAAPTPPPRCEPASEPTSFSVSSRSTSEENSSRLNPSRFASRLRTPFSGLRTVVGEFCFQLKPFKQHGGPRGIVGYVVEKGKGESEIDSGVTISGFEVYISFGIIMVFEHI